MIQHPPVLPKVEPGVELLRRLAIKRLIVDSYNFNSSQNNASGKYGLKRMRVCEEPGNNPAGYRHDMFDTMEENSSNISTL